MSTRQLSQTTGFFYLLIIVCGLFSEGYVRNFLLVPDTSHSLVEVLKTNQFSLRIGFVSDLFMVISDIIVAGLFYNLLKTVNQTLALLALFFRLIQAAVIGTNLLNFLSPLILLNQIEALNSMEMNQLNAWAQYLLECHKQGYLISQVFFSINCLLMAYLLFHSPLFSKFLGILVGLAAVAYFSDAINQFLFPGMIDLSPLLLVSVFAEISLCLSLLLKRNRNITT